MSNDSIFKPNCSIRSADFIRKPLDKRFHFFLYSVAIYDLRFGQHGRREAADFGFSPGESSPRGLQQQRHEARFVYDSISDPSTVNACANDYKPYYYCYVLVFLENFEDPMCYNEGPLCFPNPKGDGTYPVYDFTNRKDQPLYSPLLNNLTDKNYQQILVHRVWKLLDQSTSEGLLVRHKNCHSGNEYYTHDLFYATTRKSCPCQLHEKSQEFFNSLTPHVSALQLLNVKILYYRSVAEFFCQKPRNGSAKQRVLVVNEFENSSLEYSSLSEQETLFYITELLRNIFDENTAKLWYNEYAKGVLAEIVSEILKLNFTQIYESTNKGNIKIADQIKMLPFCSSNWTPSRNKTCVNELSRELSEIFKQIQLKHDTYVAHILGGLNQMDVYTRILLTCEEHLQR